MMCAICMWLPVANRTEPDGFAATITGGYALCVPHSLDPPVSVEAFKWRVGELMSQFTERTN